MDRNPRRKDALLAVLCFAWSIEGFAGQPPDAWITMKAKTALYLTENVPGRSVSMDTINGRVTLHGTVDSSREEALAVDTVSRIEGVTAVRDLLQVVPSGKRAVMAPPPDDRIKADLEKRLAADRSLDDSNLTVKSVSRGVVLMAGKAASLQDSQRALYHAANSPGVVRVTSDIDVPDMLSDEEFRLVDGGQCPAGGQSPAGRESDGAGGDLRITIATKMKLAADPRTPAIEINVDTFDGVVSLFGMVLTRESKLAAAENAWSVFGVKNVKNELKVIPVPRKDLVQARDDVVQEAVQRTLNDHGGKENASITVEVSKGIVRLTGTVPSWQRNLSVVYTARSVEGVRSVLNELRVGTQAASKS